MLWRYLLWCELAIQESTVQYCAMDLTSSSPLCCSLPLLYAILGYIVLFYPVLPLLFPAALLSFIRSPRQWNASVGFPLNSALCTCLWGQTSALWWLRPTQQLALPPSAALHLSSCLFSSTFHLFFVTHGYAFLSSPVLLTFTWSPFSNFSEKVNAVPLAAAESALMLFCQPGPASLLRRSPYLTRTSLPLSLASTSHQVAIHSSTGDSFQLWHHTTLHEPSILVQINLIGPWICADREAQPEKKTTRYSIT